MNIYFYELFLLLYGCIFFNCIETIDLTCSVNQEVSGDGRKCVCKKGYIMIDANCNDIDECVDKDNPVCPLESTCKNIPGSFECICPEGKTFKPNNDISIKGACEKNLHYCDSQTFCGKNSKCISKNCTCIIGYRWENESNSRSDCVDIDECSDKTISCSDNEECTNLPGSFKCKCLDGFHKSSRDKCIKIPGYCKNNNDCTVDGEICKSKQCNCKVGKNKVYLSNEGDNTRYKCVDNAECKIKNDKCDQNSECTEEGNNYSCKCKKGFKENNEKKCVDEDILCRDANCDHIQNTTCDSNEGVCKCPAYFNIGYLIDAHIAIDEIKCIREFECVDSHHIDQCKEKDGNSFCLKRIDYSMNNIVTDLGCKCNEFYKWNEGRTQCIDVDECQNQNICDENSVCKNTIGSYSCNCKEGYVRDVEDNSKCVDKEGCLKTECIITDSVCVNKYGINKCVCKDGYKLDKDKNSCVDKNECIEDSEICDLLSSKCENTIGSYKCLCNQGHVEVCLNDGKNCTCVKTTDDCNKTNELTVCGLNSKCNESNKCVCNEGYERSQEKSVIGCIDINECLKPGICPKDSICKNKPGSYKCGCKSGEIINPVYINGNIDKNLTEYCLKDDNDISTCVEKENNCDHETQYCFITIDKKTICECKPGYHNDKDKYWLTADDKLEVNKIEYNSNNECIDVDECKINKNICSENNSCENIIGGYKCITKDGTKETFYRDLIIKEKHVCSNESYWYLERCRSVSACNEFTNFCVAAVSPLTMCTVDEKGNSFCACKNDKSKFVDGSCKDSGDTDEGSHIFMFSIIGGCACLILILIAFGIFKTVKKKRRYGKPKYFHF